MTIFAGFAAVAFLTLFCGVVGMASLQAQNVGISVGTAHTIAGSAGSIPVNCFSNVPLAAFSVPLRLQDPDIVFDSISFEESIVKPRFLRLIQWTAGHTEVKVTIRPDGNSPSPWFQPYDEEIFRIHYHVKTGIAPGVIPIDTFFYEYYSGDLTFWDRVEVSDTIGTTIYPQFIAGSIVTMDQTTDVGADHATIPSSFALFQNFPNPFNPTTAVTFSLPKAAFVTFEVLDVNGRSAFSLAARTYPAGNHSINVDGSHLSTGVYFYRLTTPFGSQTRKMTLIK